MKIHTIKRILVTYIVNHLLAGTRFFSIKRKMLRSIGYDIGENTKVVGPIFCTGKIKTGNNCWIGTNLKVHGNGVVYIGNNCDIAPDVTFLTGGHEIGSKKRRAGKGEKYTISVGSGTWVGARTTILKNTTIGSGCVVAACSCIINDISDNELVGGVPAKKIRRLEDEDSTDVEK